MNKREKALIKACRAFVRDHELKYWEGTYTYGHVTNIRRALKIKSSNEHQNPIP